MYCKKQHDQCFNISIEIDTRSKTKVNWPLDHFKSSLFTLKITHAHKHIFPLYIRSFDCAFSRLVLIRTRIYKFQINLAVKQRLLSDCVIFHVWLHHLAAWFPCATTITSKAAAAAVSPTTAYILSHPLVT